MTDRDDSDYRSLPDYRTGQREYRSMEPGEWIEIIIQRCGLSPDVGRCLAKQLGQFEQYIIDWVRAQMIFNTGEVDSWDKAVEALKDRRDKAEKEYAEKYHPESKDKIDKL